MKLLLYSLENDQVKVFVAFVILTSSCRGCFATSGGNEGCALPVVTAVLRKDQSGCCCFAGALTRALRYTLRYVEVHGARVSIIVIAQA